MEDTQRLLFIPKQIHLKVVEVFLVYADSIADIHVDSSFEQYENMLQGLNLNIPFESDIWDFFKKHERTLAFLSRRYLEIQELGGDTEKIVLKNNQYVKYINGLQKKKIGMVQDESILNPFEKSYWDRQNLFKTIIEENILKHHHTNNGDYYYTTVDQVRKFFSGEFESKSDQGKELYQSFINQDGSCDFTLSCDSIGKYMQKLTRYFRKQRIHYPYTGHRLNIYSLVN